MSDCEDRVVAAQLLAAGRLDFNMTPDSFGSYNFVRENIPMVAVAALFQKDPKVLISHTGMGNDTLPALKGKPIMIGNDTRAGVWLFLKSKFGFTDDQIRELIRRDAVIGVAVDAIMMVHGWRHLRSKPADFDLSLEHLANHIDHICQIAGNAKHVGIGTDLDGGYGNEQTPVDLNTIYDLQTIPGLLKKRGYKKADIEGIMSGNFLNFLRRHLPA